jgi:hypothetical protein
MMKLSICLSVFLIFSVLFADAKTATGARLCWCNGDLDESIDNIVGLVCNQAGGYSIENNSFAKSNVRVHCALDRTNEATFKSGCAKYHTSSYCEDVNSVR